MFFSCVSLKLAVTQMIAFIQRNDFHHFLAGGHVLTDLHGAVADNPTDRRNHLRVLQIQFRLIELGILALGDGFGGGGAGTRRTDRLRSRVGVTQIGVGLRYLLCA